MVGGFNFENSIIFRTKKCGLYVLSVKRENVFNRIIRNFTLSHSQLAKTGLALVFRSPNVKKLHFSVDTTS